MSELEVEWEVWCLADRQAQLASRGRLFGLIARVQLYMHLSTVFWLWWGYRSYFTSSVAVPGLFQHTTARAVDTSFGDSSLVWTRARKASKRWVGFTVWSDVCLSSLVWLEPGFHHKPDFFFLSCFDSCHEMEIVHARRVTVRSGHVFAFLITSYAASPRQSKILL